MTHQRGARPRGRAGPRRPMIYLDHNATTATFPEVWEAVRPLLTGPPGNAASAHAAGRRARRALEDARERVAARLGAGPDEVVFTSGATESNNLALFGLCGDPPGHLIASPVEHPCVVEPLRQLERRGFAVDWLPVGPDGVVHAGSLAGLLRPETRLVRVICANHATGALTPGRDVVDELESGGRESPGPAQDRGTHVPRSPFFHCDAAQAVGKVAVHFGDLGVTSLSASAHKFHGPPGVGLLLVRRDAKLRPLFHGGHQQQGRRPGTEPVALAVGLAAALGLCLDRLAERTAAVERLRRRLLDGLRREAAPVVVNGPEAGGLPQTLNVSFPGCRADALLMSLDLAGVACATGSACSSGSLLPSPVLRAMGVGEERLRSAMRFSLDPSLAEDETDEAARRVGESVRRLRSAV